MRKFHTIISTVVLFSVISGCGSETKESDDDGSSGDPIEAGDGRYYPLGNNTHISEAAACAALEDAQSSRVQALKCSITTRTCPSLLRVEFLTACMEYDEGSVQGCVDYYETKKNCTDLKDAIEKCVITAFPGSEPNGCPMP
ncbi:MAG: hypothetical protein HUU21_18535 [Polyangiaceae bacterium]|nr:hypothetical protein [Polyangiaceae bacterium]NUQ75547.1 hypothetical protein [Polyangiaceae bacterium]